MQLAGGRWSLKKVHKPTLRWLSCIGLGSECKNKKAHGQLIHDISTSVSLTALRKQPISVHIAQVTRRMPFHKAHQPS